MHMRVNIATHTLGPRVTPVIRTLTVIPTTAVITAMVIRAGVIMAVCTDAITAIMDTAEVMVIAVGITVTGAVTQAGRIRERLAGGRIQAALLDGRIRVALQDAHRADSAGMASAVAATEAAAAGK